MAISGMVLGILENELLWHNRSVILQRMRAASQDQRNSMENHSPHKKHHACVACAAALSTSALVGFACLRAGHDQFFLTPSVLSCVQQAWLWEVDCIHEDH
jgi:hypothetical protein